MKGQLFLRFFGTHAKFAVLRAVHLHLQGIRMWPEVRTHFFPKAAEKCRPIPCKFLTGKYIPLFVQYQTNKMKRKGPSSASSFSFLINFTDKNPCSFKVKSSLF